MFAMNLKNKMYVFAHQLFSCLFTPTSSFNENIICIYRTPVVSEFGNQLLRAAVVNVALQFLYMPPDELNIRRKSCQTVKHIYLLYSLPGYFPNSLCNRRLDRQRYDSLTYWRAFSGACRLAPI